MIGHYSYAVFALLLICPHSTKQLFTCEKVDVMQNLLREEKTMSGDTPGEIACDLTLKKKKQLCDDLMDNYTIVRDSGNAPHFGRGEFLEGNPRLPVSPLVDLFHPHTCKPIPVDGLDVEKPMYWCPHRRYQTAILNNKIDVKGFFISSGRKAVHDVILFRPSETNEGAVNPFLMIKDVDILK